MKAIFAWLSLLASLANLPDVASGQPEEPLAIGKMPGAEVSFQQFFLFFLFLEAVFTQTKMLRLN